LQKGSGAPAVHLVAAIESIHLMPATAMITSQLRRLAALLAFACGAGLPAHAADQARAVYDFNPGWKLHVGDAAQAGAPAFDDAAWQAVTLPHAWNEDDAFRKDIAALPTGIAWYRKHFTLPAGAKGKKVFLEFEGVRQAGEVFVNGQRALLHENGAMAFGVDISTLAVAGENVVAVRTDNAWDYKEKESNQRFQWSDANFNANYGGIPKNVRLHVADKLYQTLPLYSTLGTTGVYIYAQDIDIAKRSATIVAESQVRNEYADARSFTYEVAVRDKDGKLVARFTAPPQRIAAGATATVKASARVAGLNFWSWGYGYLYDVATAVAAKGQPADVVHTRTGFRKTEFANGMIKLNERVMQVHGYAQRTSNEWPAVGMSVPPWLSDYSNGLMVDSNANLVRWMHITPWKQDVESLDRVGLGQAMPAGDSEADVTGKRWDQRIALMRDAIIYNRNSPSILFYESGNRGVSEAHMGQMKALRDLWDPHGGRASGSREMLNSRVADYGGEMLYINKSARIPMWAMEYSRDEGLRKYWDELSPPFHRDGDGPLYKNQDASTYNRNQDSHAIEDVKRWYDYWRERPGTGTRVSSGGVNIIFSDTNTHHRGLENYRRSGEVDAMRIAKDGFYAHQVVWDGWVDIERPRIHIIGHWNYAPAARKTVTVVSSAEQVELFLNGVSLGRGARSEQFLFAFKDVAWQSGELRAVGYGLDGAIVCDTTVSTAGAPAALRLTARTAPAGLRADGADLALLEVDVIDAAGRRNPIALDMVDFKVDGPAEWRGGIAQGPDNYILAKSLPVEGGVNRVLLRSTTQAGDIVVTASAAGLRGATLTLHSLPVKVAGGLATPLAGASLPSRLGRGPTPSTPSYKVSRIAAQISAVAAGSNAEAAANSFDDDETTSWTSAKGADQAWIAYTLARPALLTEATFKLAGWRERSYPLRITVDGQEVYQGETPKNLGYVTLPLKPVRGSVVRIELVGLASENDAFKLVEVANQAITDTGANRTSTGVLSIVEAEFYEAAR
jgi:beta-galactosidase